MKPKYVDMKSLMKHLDMGRYCVMQKIALGMPVAPRKRGGHYQFSLDAVDEWMVSGQIARRSKPPVQEGHPQRGRKRKNKGEIDLAAFSVGAR